MQKFGVRFIVAHPSVRNPLVNNFVFRNLSSFENVRTNVDIDKCVCLLFTMHTQSQNLQELKKLGTGFVYQTLKEPRSTIPNISEEQSPITILKVSNL